MPEQKKGRCHCQNLFRTDGPQGLEGRKGERDDVVKAVLDYAVERRWRDIQPDLIRKDLSRENLVRVVLEQGVVRVEAVG